MIKVLQRKFVISSMTAVSILLLALLGAINISNIIITLSQAENTLSDIIQAEVQQISQPHINPGNQGNQIFGGEPKPFPEMNMTSLFFVARFDDFGEIVQVDTSKIVGMTEDEAKALALQAWNSSESEGKISGFKYASETGGAGKVYVFLDVSYQTYSVISVLFLSVFIGLVCWVLMLILIIFLSKRAIKPIAENIERQKQFVTDAGHEIKTPLSIILANTDALELHNGENKWSKNIRAQTVRLNGLMQNLLTLARIDESRIDETKETFSLNEAVEQTSNMFLEMLSPKNLTMRKYFREEININANRELISRLVSILLDNAVKYARRGSEIGIELYKNDRTITLAVVNQCDNLPDCPPEKLFDRFYRGNSARTQKSGGYGIGLSAAASIAELHKGSIKAIYEGGSTIIFKAEFKNQK